LPAVAEEGSGGPGRGGRALVAEDLAKVEPLSLEDARLTRRASELGDHVFIKNLRVIRAELLLDMANPFVRSVNSGKFAKRFGVDPSLVQNLKNSVGFRKELNDLVREQVLGKDGRGVMLAETYKGLAAAVTRGEPWAIQTSLRLHGLTGSGAKQEASGSFEDGVK